MLSVIIPAGGATPRLRCTLTCLAAGIRAQATDIEVIVVNDGAGSEIRKCVETSSQQLALDFQLVEIPRSGRSAARNAGAAQACGSRLLFIDSDILLEREALGFHSSLGRQDAGYDIGGGESCLVRDHHDPPSFGFNHLSADDGFRTPVSALNEHLRTEQADDL